MTKEPNYKTCNWQGDKECETFSQPCRHHSLKKDIAPKMTNYSKRGTNWIRFQERVLHHIETYTIPQYGDKPNDQITEWSVEDCFTAVKKRIARYGRNSREGQQELDFLKAAHELQIAWEKWVELENGGLK